MRDVVARHEILNARNYLLTAANVTLPGWVKVLLDETPIYLKPKMRIVTGTEIHRIVIQRRGDETQGPDVVREEYVYRPDVALLLGHYVLASWGGRSRPYDGCHAEFVTGPHATHSHRERSPVMMLEPTPIGTPDLPNKEPAPPRTRRTLAGQIFSTPARAFAVGLLAGILGTLAVSLPIAQSRENEWQEKFDRQNGITKPVLPATRR